MSKVAGLVIDPTRAEVVKHEVGKKVAEQTVARLEQSKATILKVADDLYGEFDAAVDAAFVLKPERAFIQGRIIDKLADLASKADLTGIRRIMDDDKEAASLIWHTPSYLLNLADEPHANLKTDAVKRHARGGAAAFIHSRGLTALATNYDKVIAGVRGSFYVEALAEQAKLRVEA